jgi:uracil-xanthine permease
MKLWKLRKKIPVGGVVKPDERLPWLMTTGIGMQHVVAMFGATFLVPLLTGFPPTTTIFFSGVGTLLFLIITRNKVPSYLGSSFAFIAPVIAAKEHGGMAAALGGILVAGAVLALVGLLVNFIGSKWINWLMPPIVTGAIVALIGLNLAPTAWNGGGGGGFQAQPGLALATLASILLITVLFKGFIGRLSIFLGVVVGWLLGWALGDLSPIKTHALATARWIGLPTFTTPHFTLNAITLIVPVVIVLIAENTGHVKAVASMTERNLDKSLGRAYAGDGIATMLAGLGGGSGTTTYAENIGVMAATRVYSTAAYAVAGAFAILLSMCPKFGALITTMPTGVLGGAVTVLYGLIVVLGARIWVEAKIDFRNTANLIPAAIALIVGAANYTYTRGNLSFSGIAIGAVTAILAYHVMRIVGSRTGALSYEMAHPASTPAVTAPPRKR